MAMLNNQMVNHQTSGCGSPPLFINFGPGLSGRTAFVSPTCENISPEDNEIVEELEEGQRDEDLKCIYIYSGWWFQTFFIFHNIWDNPSHWLIFFKMVETTNHIYIYYVFNCFYMRPQSWENRVGSLLLQRVAINLNDILLAGLCL